MSTAPESISITEHGLELPVAEVMTGRGFITGKSGSGKSNSASVIAEGLLEHGLPMMIIDTDGEYFGLQERYKILHATVDETGDLEVGPDDAERLAGLALDGNVPIVLDISGYMDLADGKILVHRVLREIFRMEDARRKPFLVIVEEVHEYLPERGGHGELGELLIQIAKRGRKRGLGLCGISQRPAAVSKEFITQCDWLIWHRLTWENDIQVVRRLLGTDAADEIQELKDGEAFLMTDWADEIQRIRFRRKRTHDAGATPDIAEVTGGPDGNLEPAVLEALNIEGKSASSEDSEEDSVDPRDEKILAMQQRIEELEAELERSRNAESSQKIEEPQMAEAEGGFLITGIAELTSFVGHTIQVVTQRTLSAGRSLSREFKRQP